MRRPSKILCRCLPPSTALLLFTVIRLLPQKPKQKKDSSVIGHYDLLSIHLFAFCFASLRWWPISPEEPPNRSMTMRIGIIGGGIAGLMSGAHLLNTGHNVTLFEKEKQVGQHATGRNAGSFSLHYGSLEVCQLADQSRNTLEKPFWKPSGTKGYLHHRGKVFLARKEQSAAILKLQEKTKSNGHKLEKLLPEEALHTLAPLALHLLPGDQFLFDSDHFDIDVPLLVGDLEEYIHKHPNGRVITDFEVSRIESMQDKWHIYADQCNDSEMFDVVVNASGAWADRIAHSAGVPPIGLKNLGRTAAWLDFNHDFSKETRNVPMVHEVEDRFFARPFQNRWFLSPSDAVEGRIEEALPDLKALKTGVESFQSWFSGLEVENISPFVGIRSFSQDNRPEISQNQIKPTYFTLSALGGYGIKMSARAAEILVDKITSLKS